MRKFKTAWSWLCGLGLWQATYFRIHCATEPWTIKQSVAGGCIPMLNHHVVQLYEEIPVGTPVTAL